jgi:hypothetical protein
MILLTATTHALELGTSSTSSTDWTCSYVDMTSTDTTPGSEHGNVASATTTTIAAAPAASTQRQIKHISLRNKNTASQTVTIKKDVSGTEYVVFRATLESNEGAEYNDGKGWTCFDAQGRAKTMEPASLSQTGARPRSIYKTGTAAEGTAYWYGYWKDAGFPGAWSPNTSGINGRATDGMAAGDVGCLELWTPNGALYLEAATSAVTATAFPMLFDVLWVNNGIVVTTTTAQAITTPTLPARDDNGATIGEGCMIGLIWTAASTNAAAITNSTVTYTNSAGTGSRTATLVAVAGDQIPPTPVIGTVVWFRLADGDTGVRSIQSITLGTSLVTGSVSLIIARPLTSWANSTVNVGFRNEYKAPGLRLWTGTCALMFHKSVSSSATTIHATFEISER